MQERFIPCYEASVLRALEEVENVLVAYAKEQVRRDSLGRAAAAAQRAAAVAQDRYQAGLVDFNNVLDAQRSLLILQDQMDQSNGAVISNLIRLYKVLGGGWSSFEAKKDRPKTTALADQKTQQK